MSSTYHLQHFIICHHSHIPQVYHTFIVGYRSRGPTYISFFFYHFGSISMTVLNYSPTHDDNGPLYIDQHNGCFGPRCVCYAKLTVWRYIAQHVDIVGTPAILTSPNIDLIIGKESARKPKDPQQLWIPLLFFWAKLKQI